MKRRTALTAISAALLLAFAAPVAAQSAKSLVGTWQIVSTENVDPSGKTTQQMGANPQGQLIFTPNGRYSLTLARSDLPKFAANSRDKGTAAENQAVVAGSIAHSGRYSVDEKEKSFTYHPETSTYPNWLGTSQKRVFTVSGDELRYTNPVGSAGGQRVDLVWKRVQ